MSKSGVDRYLGHSIAINAHIAEVLGNLLSRANVLSIQLFAGWAETLVGTGTTYESLSKLTLESGTTASSSAILTNNIPCLNTGNLNFGRLDWDKKLYLIFQVLRYNSVATGISRVQLKDVQTLANLGAKGIGLYIDNLALYGESYGTARATVDLGVTLTNARHKLILIVHDPSVPKIEWYVNGVLKGTQSTADNIPSGTSADDESLVFSVENGATAANTRMDLASIWIWQAR